MFSEWEESTGKTITAPQLTAFLRLVMGSSVNDEQFGRLLKPLGAAMAGDGRRCLERFADWACGDELPARPPQCAGDLTSCATSSTARAVAAQATEASPAPTAATVAATTAALPPAAPRGGTKLAPAPAPLPPPGIVPRAASTGGSSAGEAEVEAGGGRDAPLALPGRVRGNYWAKAQSELLGVSVAYLAGADFAQEVASRFGAAVDPDFHELSSGTGGLFCGPRGKGLGRTCPRDGLPGCSFVDALEERHVGRATVLLSAPWTLRALEVAGSLSRWCQQHNLDPERTFVWHCAFCNNQYRLAEQQKQQQESSSLESFREPLLRRVRCIGEVLLVLAPWHTPTCLKRLWCLAEIAIALRTEGSRLTVALLEREEAPFLEALASTGLQPLRKAFKAISLRKAEAHFPSDRDNLLRLLDWDFTYSVQQQVRESPERRAVEREVSSALLHWLAERVASGVEAHLAAGKAVSLEACANAASLLLEARNWARAEQLLAASRSLCEESSSSNTLLHAVLLQSTGLCLGSQGQHDLALEYYAEARQAYKLAGATESLGYMSLLKSMAARLRSQGRQQEALELYRLAMASPAEAKMEAARVRAASSDSLDGSALQAAKPAAAAGGTSEEGGAVGLLDASSTELDATWFLGTAVGEDLLGSGVGGAAPGVSVGP